jgi:hypothetical protein
MEEPVEAYKAAKEMLVTEKEFWKDINLAITAYERTLMVLEDMGQPVLPTVDIRSIFRNLDDVEKVSRGLLDDLQELADERKLVEELPRVITHWTVRFTAFKIYMESYDKAVDRLVQLESSKPAFAKFIKCTNSLLDTSLPALLILPLQRLPRYALLLAKMLPKLTGDSKDWCEKAIKAVEEVTSDIQTSLVEKDFMVELEQLHEQFEVDARYVDVRLPGRNC